MKSGWGVGVLILLWVLAVTAAGIGLSLSTSWAVWLPGQIVLAIAMLQWFCVLHECGHETLFPGKTANTLAGHFASVFCGLPYFAWKWIHYRHHVWAGWKDIDPTTEQVIPRELKAYEKFVLNVCWKTGFPLFSVLYRLDNYWHFFRLWRLFDDRRRRRTIAWNFVFYFGGAAAAVVFLGPWECLRVGGVAFFIHLCLCDPILLSQHTHIPQQLAAGEKVKPFEPRNQEVFTRSLEFPRWFSRFVLFNFDAHELHHIYPQTPGYRLHQIDYRAENSIHWWVWLRKAKAIPASVFLFSNRDATGFSL
ncbi:MAG: fatty acid desaturase [Planctomycetota bacterium]|nr:fatty acid desaturase [Planctomycetota bacterium]